MSFSSISNNNQNYFSDIFLQFESLLNSPSDWQSNPIEATRQGMKLLYSIIKSNSNNINQLERTKATKSELTSSLNVKANVADIMRTFSEIAVNIENRPTIDEVQILLDDKVSKTEFKSLTASKYASIDDVKAISNSVESIIKNYLPKKVFDEIINTKANKDNVINALHKKANKTDIEIQLNNKINSDDYTQTINELHDKINQLNHNHININEEKYETLSKRIDDIDQDVDRLVENIKKQFQNMSNTLNILTTNKADYKEVQNLIASHNNNARIEEGMLKLKNQNEENFNKIQNDLTNQFVIIEKKIQNEMLKCEMNTNTKNQELSNEFSNIINNINNDINKLNKQISLEIPNKSDMDAISQQINELTQLSLLNDEKNKQFILKQTFDSYCNNIEKQLSAKIEEVQLYLQDYLKQFDKEIQDILNMKADVTQMNNIKQSCSNVESILKGLDNKISRNEFDSLKLTLEQLSQDYINKIDYSKFDSFANATSSTIEEIQKDLMMKANIKEMMSYLDNKADIDDVNKALSGVHEELDTKSSLEEFNNAMDNQNLINEALCKENCLGRWSWSWSSCPTKNGYAVPWTEQIINTSPENFIWEKEKTHIQVIEKGIYMIQLAFFVKDKPVVQVLVNGEETLSLVGGSMSIVKHESGVYGREEFEERIGVVTGVSMVEYLNLDEKSRVTISYSGDINVKGFMMLKKI